MTEGKPLKCFHFNMTVAKNIFAFGNCVKFIFLFSIFFLYFLHDIEGLSGSSNIFLLKLYNYISRFCCSCSFVLSCLVFYSIPKSEKERKREIFMQFTYRRHNICVFHNFRLFSGTLSLSLSLPLFVSHIFICHCCCSYCCCCCCCCLCVFAGLFRTALQMGHSGPFNAIPWPGFLLASLTI